MIAINLGSPANDTEYIEDLLKGVRADVEPIQLKLTFKSLLFYIPSGLLFKVIMLVCSISNKYFKKMPF